MGNAVAELAPLETKLELIDAHWRGFTGVTRLGSSADHVPEIRDWMLTARGA